MPSETMPPPGRVSDALADLGLKAAKEKPLGGNLPVLDLSDPAQLEAFYGNFAFFDHYRKSVLAECWEIERAKAVGEKTTEARLENLARMHPNYLDFLAQHFIGRWEREKNVFASLRNGQ